MDLFSSSDKEGRGRLLLRWVH